MKYEEHSFGEGRLPFIFRCDTMYGGDRDFTHWHENIEILCFLEGEGRVICDFRKEEVRAGDLYVINPERLHMIESDDRVKYYCLIPDTDFCERNGIRRDLLYRSKIKDPLLLEKYGDVVKSYAEQSEFRETRIRIAVLQLLLTLAEDFQAKGEEKADDAIPHLQNIKEAIRYLKIHFQEPVSVKNAARAAGLSEAYFSREFHRITGFTPIRYLNLVRCQYAGKLLRSGKYKIYECAGEAGFENLSYFTKTYKKIMGVLPSDEKRG